MLVPRQGAAGVVELAEIGCTPTLDASRFADEPCYLEI